jgi:hypothetical protein
MSTVTKKNAGSKDAIGKVFKHELIMGGTI